MPIWGRSSLREAVMSNGEDADYEEFASGRVAVPSMARRQLTASVIVAFVIAAASG